MFFPGRRNHLLLIFSSYNRVEHFARRVGFFSLITSPSTDRERRTTIKSVQKTAYFHEYLGTQAEQIFPKEEETLLRLIRFSAE